MCDVVCIELDKKEFPTEQSCKDWIMSSKYEDLFQLKTFSFKKRPQARFFTNEKKRAVWYYERNIHMYPNLAIERFQGGVVVKGVGPKFTKAEIPQELAETLLREQKRKEAMAARIEKQRKIRADKLAALGDKAPKPKNRGGVKDTTKSPRPKRSKKQKKAEDDLGIKVGPTETVSSATTDVHQSN